MDRKDTTKVRRCAWPIWLERDDRKRAVLGLHGYGGYPGELALPATQLHESGFSVFVPRLPGHGTSQKDFDTTTAHDWLLCADEACRQLVSTYEEVFIVGHSMGGLLACILASRYPVSATVLLAPALVLKQRVTRLIPLLSPFLHRIPLAWEPDPEVPFFDERDEGDDEYLGREYWSQFNLRKANQLVRLQRLARRSLGAISNPVLTIVGSEDRTVSVDVIDQLDRSLVCEHEGLLIPGASHLLPYEKDGRMRAQIIEAILSFLTTN